jgi:hypothetical protein
MSLAWDLLPRLRKYRRIMEKCGDEIGFLAEEMRRSSVREMDMT